MNRFLIRSAWTHAADKKAAPRGDRRQLNIKVIYRESREAGAQGRKVISKVHGHVNVTPDKGGAEPGLPRPGGLNGGDMAAESGEAQPLGGRCSSDAFQKQQQKQQQN